MSSYKTRAVSLIAFATLAMVLSACGYRPLYGRSSINPTLESDLSAVSVARLSDRAGQILHTELTRRLNPKAASTPAKYKLTVTMSESIQRLAVLQNTSATRANLRMNATYKLIKSDSGQEVRKGKVKTVASYNLISSDYATLISEKDARERAIKSLAEQLHQQVAFYFHNPNASGTVAD